MFVVNLLPKPKFGPTQACDVQTNKQNNSRKITCFSSWATCTATFSRSLVCFCPASANLDWSSLYLCSFSSNSVLLLRSSPFNESMWADRLVLSPSMLTSFFYKNEKKKYLKGKLLKHYWCHLYSRDDCISYFRADIQNTYNEDISYGTYWKPVQLTFSSSVASFSVVRLFSKLVILSVRSFWTASVSLIKVSFSFFHSSRAWCSCFSSLHSFWLAVRLDFSSWLSFSRTVSLLVSFSASCLCFCRSFWDLQCKKSIHNDWRASYRYSIYALLYRKTDCASFLSTVKLLTCHFWSLHQKWSFSCFPARGPKPESAAPV